MREFYELVRTHLRGFWFALVREYKDALSTCWQCGRYGASVCSLVYPKRLCDECSIVVCKTAERLGSRGVRLRETPHDPVEL